ncbi:peptide chain release factor N(5)-glutamine methyltransferase [Arcanobacterium bovis]|uniref:Peptide chain release factor N(5)-glutamine methyltransferase n=1 Tax=Arcanobacterium bovis TaxID=2529275 RepID=A0A4Q9UZW6_9ACTO|nr:peptide chain release factor N(5)-glutamine methyltransferase [Arcanobacterium bovis]TBW21564.1 peptide chain release factor N(5)-glutamine methyltransferase [Arcanobacterium bovis]
MVTTSWQVPLSQAIQQLCDAGVPSPKYDARSLAEHCFGRVPVASEPISAQMQASFEALVRRRAEREPLQHILGTMWFRYLELESRPGVFITRPETELVAQAAIDEANRLIKDGIENPRILDLCTGSGAIAISIATEVPQCQVTAVELSEVAFESAQRNNAAYGNRVELVQADALQFGIEVKPSAVATVDTRAASPVEKNTSSPSSEECVNEYFDVVVSNPPYVPRYHDLAPEVLSDPHMALFGGGDDGLEFPTALIAHAAKILKPGALLVMEHADEQGKALRETAGQYFSQVRTGTDYSGADRWLWARK